MPLRPSPTANLPSRAPRNRSASTLILLLVHLPGRHNRQRHCTGWRPFKHSLRRGQHARHCFMRQLWWAEHMQSSSCCSLLRYHTEQNRTDAPPYMSGGGHNLILTPPPLRTGLVQQGPHRVARHTARCHCTGPKGMHPCFCTQLQFSLPSLAHHPNSIHPPGHSSACGAGHCWHKSTSPPCAEAPVPAPVLHRLAVPHHYQHRYHRHFHFHFHWHHHHYLPWPPPGAHHPSTCCHLGRRHHHHGAPGGGGPGNGRLPPPGRRSCSRRSSPIGARAHDLEPMPPSADCRP